MTITYTIGDTLYLNITNQCPCLCEFCIRKNGDSVGDADTLWLEKEPTYEEICNAIDEQPLNEYRQIVFCGYGEPLCRLDMVCQVASYLKKRTTTPLRINTNGLSDLIYDKKTAPILNGLIDTVSISLNAPTAEEYDAVCHSKFGLQAFDAMIAFTKDCLKQPMRVILSVVDYISEDQIKRCEALADELGATLRVRSWEH